MYPLLLTCAALFSQCGISAIPLEPVDRHATPETRALLLFLDTARQAYILFGHQETTLYGVGWTATGTDDSDVKRATGKFPAVFGWELGNLSPDHLDALREHVLAAHGRGGINTFSWHCPNPVSGGNFYDTTPAVAALLPGGDHHAWFREKLDILANFFHALKDPEGRPIPVVFRPWHEHNGNWFWWGTPFFCAPEQFADLWRFTVVYLCQEKSVHNLLFAWSPNESTGKTSGYFTGYPGDAHVDILGLDAYAPSLKTVLPEIRNVVQEAETRRKIPALTETGYPDGLSACRRDAPFTGSILEPLRGDPVARRIAWLLVWRNAHEHHYWVPRPDDRFADDFRAFCADPLIVMGDRLEITRRNPMP
ncbi:MAG TPA: glycosyl hydrolase [Candidatus Hydrogenedentes bacterium]|nr:glycosyl hydrolase [Candidatus Hydrogenedentota bacterium]